MAETECRNAQPTRSATAAATKEEHRKQQDHHSDKGKFKRPFAKPAIGCNARDELEGSNTDDSEHKLPEQKVGRGVVLVKRLD